MLAIQLQISLRDVFRVGHIVIHSRYSQPVRAATVFLDPSDRRIDWHVGYMNTLSHEFPCHALFEADLS